MLTLQNAFTEFFDLVPEEDLVESQDYLRGLTVRWTRAMAVLMVVSVTVMWPTDFVVFSGYPAYQHALGIWRAVLITTSFFLALGLTYSNPIRRYPVHAFIVAAAVVMGASGFAVGQLGGIDNPFFYAVYPIPATTVALLSSLRLRIVANLTIAIAYLAGFIYAISPQPVPLMFAGPVIFLGASVAGMIFLGHVVYRLVASNYSRRARLQLLVASQKSDLALATREALTAHDKVRESVLRDLHDNVGPIITALHLDTFAARQGLQRSPQAPKVAQEFLHTVEEHAKTLKHIIRGTLRDLDPYGIERGSLTDVIGNTLSELGIPESIGLSCELDPLINELPNDIKQALHLIVRECANNTVKHSKATHVRMDARVAHGELLFAFADNGIGCELDRVDTGHYGLAGLRLRAIDAGGRADMKSAPGQGFSIEIRIPLAHQSAGTRA